MRLLIVEDDRPIRVLVAQKLELQGFTVATAASLHDALGLVASNRFDVAILDRNLPDGSGLEVLRALRESGSDTHVLILSGAGSEADRVEALEVGADDYVVKPFFVRELVARVLAVERRQEAAKDQRLRYDRVTIDLRARQVTIDGEEIELTAKEFDLLAFLAARPGHAFSRDQLLRSVWQSAPDWQRPSTVTEHVRRLRSKLEDDARAPRLLQTVRGVGYRFGLEPDAPSAVPASGEPPQVGRLVVLGQAIVLADAAAAAIVGVASEHDLIGRVASDFIAPQSVTAVRDRRDIVEAGGEPRSQIVALRREDGIEVFAAVASRAVDWRGSPARELEIRPSTDPSERLRQLVTGVLGDVSDAVVVTDLNFHVRSWNAGAERLYGWTEEEVRGRHLFDLIPLLDSGVETGISIAALEETGRWFGEGRQIGRDGLAVTVAVTTSLVRDGGGSPIAVVTVTRPTGPSTDHAPARHDPLEDERIRQALDRDEFVVHYQPVVSLDDLHVVGVEALVRWDHPERGLLAPEEFLAPIEENGMIIELGRVIREKACRQAAAWRSAGIGVDVAINLSSREVAHPDLFDHILSTLAATGLDPHAVWLEVTETALVEDLDVAADLFRRLSESGIRIAIDDFGTGWASLTYLRQFEVAALKIDRTFVDGIATDSQDAAIARSILSLGAELDLTVVAEGVETTEQAAALRAMGCSLAQGYLYGRAVDASVIDLRR